ncbi:hypothetical protein GMLC_01290 [Geomonas limicola]|uniref:Methyltransferase domain-containing protein n=1 Tax=Geomonas limicola TaxID=2740186 RepID=A0A6V8N2H0_9BACT|nr:methyltransferase domain-containing protein [Geomonas limicola]GFO66550.1 hypothetical protein GMLC_01290 [Geomonas limicola]
MSTEMGKDGVQDYTLLASDYDALRYTEEGQLYLDHLRHQAMRELLCPTREMEIIDVGTGTGSGIMFFARSVKSMVGLDATAAMLDKARAKMETLGIDNVRLIQGNAFELPFDDESFDHVISLNFIHLFAAFSLDRQIALVAEMERVCKKGGRVVIEFDNKRFLKELGNSFDELPRMSSTMRLEKVVGTYLPKTKTLFRVSRGLAGLYSSLARVPVLERFAYKWIAQYRKI